MIKEDGVKHYCLVKSPSHLLFSQLPKNNGKHYICLGCLNHFGCEEASDKPEEYCDEYESVRIRMPERGTSIIFDHYNKQERVPFVVNADFKCYNVPIHTFEPNPKSSYTKQYKNHEPSSFCYYIKSIYEVIYVSKKVSYTGEDAAQKIVEMLS